MPLGDGRPSKLASLLLDDKDALPDKELEGGVVADVLRPFGGEGVEKVPAADEGPAGLEAVNESGDVGVNWGRRLKAMVGDVEGQREVSPMFDVEGREARARVDGGVVGDPVLMAN